MNKRERLGSIINGDAPDRVAVALWRHWQGDDQRANDLAQATLQFQSLYDWDVVIVAPSNHFSLTGYGLQDVWQGAQSGERVSIKSPIKRSLDWTELRPLDPTKGDLGKQLDCLRFVGEGLDNNQTPYQQVIYSPLSQAMRLGGVEQLIRNLRTQPERLQSGLNTLTESTLRFLDAMKKTTIAGIYYVIDLANYELLSESEYMSFGLPYDQKILSNLPNKWWLNTVYIQGKNPIMGLFNQLPIQMLNWQTDGTPNLDRGRMMFSGAIMGGLNDSDILNGTPLTLRDQSREAIHVMNGKRLLLSSDGNIPITTPVSNLYAVRNAVQMAVI
jgi:uroporphyrinogen decarboxylase